VAGAAGVAYAAVASSTRPFTWSADVVTAIPVAVGASITVWSMVRKAGTGTGDRDSHGTGPAPWSRWWSVWLVPLAAATAWELYCFAHLPRLRHPTLSALIDILDSTRIGKTVAFVLWLALGWLVVIR
jgi:hypothetical protein